MAPEEEEMKYYGVTIWGGTRSRDLFSGWTTSGESAGLLLLAPLTIILKI